MVNSYSTLSGARLLTAGITTAAHPCKDTRVCMCDLDEQKPVCMIGSGSSGWCLMHCLEAGKKGPEPCSSKSWGLSYTMILSITWTWQQRTLSSTMQKTAKWREWLVCSKGNCQLKGHRWTEGMGQKKPHENQAGEMPNPGNTWAADSLHSWSVVLGIKKKHWDLCQWAGMRQPWTSQLTLVWADSWADKSPEVPSSLNYPVVFQWWNES